MSRMPPGRGSHCYGRERHADSFALKISCNPSNSRPSGPLPSAGRRDDPICDRPAIVEISFPASIQSANPKPGAKARCSALQQKISSSKENIAA